MTGISDFVGSWGLKAFGVSRVLSRLAFRFWRGGGVLMGVI